MLSTAPAVSPTMDYVSHHGHLGKQELDAMNGKEKASPTWRKTGRPLPISDHGNKLQALNIPGDGFPVVLQKPTTKAKYPQSSSSIRSFSSDNVNNTAAAPQQQQAPPQQRRSRKVLPIRQLLSVRSRSADDSYPCPCDNSSDNNNSNENGNKNSMPRRSVSFGDAPSETIIHIEHLKKIPKREKSQRWFNSRDFANMQFQNRSVVQLMEMGCTEKSLATFADNGNIGSSASGGGGGDNSSTAAAAAADCCAAHRWTTRGLERHTVKGMTQYYEKYRDAVTAVLAQQQHHESGGCHRNNSKHGTKHHTAADSIAEMYKRETEKAQKVAVLQGLRDAKEVRDYLADCDTETIRQAHLTEQQQQQQAESNNKRSTMLGFLKRFSSVRALTTSSSPSSLNRRTSR